MLAPSDIKAFSFLFQNTRFEKVPVEQQLRVNFKPDGYNDILIHVGSTDVFSTSSSKFIRLSSFHLRFYLVFYNESENVGL